MYTLFKVTGSVISVGWLACWPAVCLAGWQGVNGCAVKLLVGCLVGCLFCVFFVMLLVLVCSLLVCGFGVLFVGKVGWRG